MAERTELRNENPEQLFDALVEIVDGLLVARPRFVMIENSSDRYVQALTDVDAGLQIETVSNRFLDAGTPLRPRDDAHLGHMRWRPASDHSPNWHRTFVHLWPWPAPVAAQLLAYSLLAAHDVGREPLSVTYGDANPDMRVRPCDEQCRMARCMSSRSIERTCK